MNLKKVLFSASILTALTVPVANATSIVTEWNAQIRTIAEKNTPPPTTSTRLFAMFYGSMYEAWQTYEPKAVGQYVGNALDGVGGPRNESNKEEAVSFAAYHLLTSMFPDTKEQLDPFMADHGYVLDADNPAANLGRNVAQIVLDARAKDGSNADRGYVDGTEYVPQDPSNPEVWQPLDLSEFGLGVQVPLNPHWKRVTPFALHSADQFRLDPPAKFDSPEWHSQIETLISYSANLTPEQKVVAEYWRPSIATPPHLLLSLNDYVSEQNNYTLDQDVKMFFVVANAMFDAGISCWESKFFYDYVRPVTAIRALGDVEIQAWAGPNLGTQTIKAKDWNPYQRLNDPTPPFPEYGSGHSTFSGAWAEAMKKFTGSDDFGYEITIDELEFEDLPIEPVTLSFPTFSSAAWGDQGSGISRLYGGIHWPQGNERSLEAGQKIGALVYERSTDLFEGRANPLGAAFAALDETQWSRLVTSAYQPPMLTANESGLGLFVIQPGAGTFGSWQTGPLDPPCAGSYRLTISISPLKAGDDIYLPETRVRVFDEDNTFSAMGLAAQTNLGEEYPNEIQVLWTSDGITPVRLAIDLLAFRAKTDGGITVTEIKNERLILD